MKDIPIIINRKQPFQSIRRSRVLSLCRSLSRIHYLDHRFAHALFFCCCVMGTSCGSLFYMCWLLFLAFALLWSQREQLTTFGVYPLSCWLSHAVTVCWHLCFYIFLAFFLGGGGKSPSCNPVCLHYCDVQLSRDRAVSGKHITKGRTWPIWRSVLVKVKLWMAPGIWSPQLPACIQLCFSYLIFYGAFGAVYRNNKAVFLRLYGISLEVFQMCWFSFAESAASYSFQKLCVE